MSEGGSGSGKIRRGFALDDTGGEIAHAGAGKTDPQRIREATAGLLEKAGPVGERLSGIAEDVRTYATGERDSEPTRHGLEQAGAEFKWAAAPLVRRLNAVEKRKIQYARINLLSLTQQNTYQGPTLEKPGKKEFSGEICCRS